MMIKCECGNDIGTYSERDGKVMLAVGGLVLRDAWGWCAKCGRDWAWNASEKRLEQLIEKIIDNRKII